MNGIRVRLRSNPPINPTRIQLTGTAERRHGPGAAWRRSFPSSLLIAGFAAMALLWLIWLGLQFEQQFQRNQHTLDTMGESLGRWR